MPVNKEGVEVTYTSNQDVKYLLEEAEEGTDYAVEFTGYLAEVFGHSKVQIQKSGEEIETDLFKAIITNGSKRMTLLIWGPELIEKYSKLMASGTILHLDGCHGQMAKQKNTNTHPSYIKNLLNYEIIVQPGSVVESKGTHVHSVKVNKIIPLIEFLDIAKASGEFKLRAYIKTVFTEAHNMNGPTGFGSGSITKGVHKVPVQIKSFKAGGCANLTKGSCIMLRGTVRRSGKLTIMCHNISCIDSLQDQQQMSIEDVSNANKPLKRLESNFHEESPAKKKSCFEPTKENKSDNTMMDVDGIKKI